MKIGDPVLKIIYPYIKNKEVLDIGCIEHDIKYRNVNRSWVHDFLRKYAKEVIGIDILEEDIKILQKEGYNVYLQNAEEFSFDKKFDVIFAGELIEHLSNPGLFLERCYLHLRDNGVLIITTPNAFNLHRLCLSLVRLNNNPPLNIEHTFWFSPTVITSLLNRHNFRAFKIVYVDYPYKNPRMDFKMFNLLSKPFQDLKETMILVSRKTK